MAKTKAQQAVAAARQVKKNAKEAQRAAKKQQMEQKKKKKTEEKQAERLRKVMVTYKENNHKNERDYVVQMIDSNPAWVPKLAKVIRQGGMRILLELEEKEASAEAVDYGEKWKGKAKTLLELPTSVLQEMIMATVDPQHPVPELTSKSDEWWKACFKYQFHVDEKTPLPQHPLIRHMLVLKEMKTFPLKARTTAAGVVVESLAQLLISCGYSGLEMQQCTAQALCFLAEGGMAWACFCWISNASKTTSCSHLVHEPLHRQQAGPKCVG